MKTEATPTPWQISKAEEKESSFIREMAVRCNLIMPETDIEMTWFDDACDVTKSDFIDRLYKKLGMVSEHARRVRQLRKLRP